LYNKNQNFKGKTKGVQKSNVMDGKDYKLSFVIILKVQILNFIKVTV